MRTLRLVHVGPIALLCFVFAGYIVFPFTVTVVESLRVNGTFSFGHYLDLFDPGNKANAEAVWNSVFVSILSVLLSGIVGVLFAFVFTQIEFPLKSLLSRLAILPIALPPLVGVISFLFVFGESGILPRVLQQVLMSRTVPFYLDGVGAIVVIHVYSFYVYFYLFVSTALRRLDASVLEAASNLGSTTWNTLRRIVLPEMRPALVGASILTFMASMVSFTAPLLFAGEKRFMTLQIYTTKLNGELDLAAAQSIILTLLSVAFFIVMNLSAGSRVSFRRTKGVVRSRPLELSKHVKFAFVAVAAMLLIVELLPISTIVLISFAREGSWTSQIFPAAYTADNYVKLVTDPHVFEPVRNSLLMGLMTTAAAVVIGVSAAYLVTKGGLGKSRVIIDVLLNLPYAIPGTVIAISLILSFNSPTVFSGYTILVGTFWILPIAYVVRTYPLVVRSTAAALEQLDDSLLEAGQTFGAGVWRRFRKIALPIILPGIVSGSLLTMIAALGEFVSSILLYTYASRPISIEILSQLRTFSFGSAAAYSVILLVLIVMMIFLANRLLDRSTSELQALNF